MRNSITQTVTVNQIAEGSNPSRLIQASDVPMRVVVRNTGGTTLLIAHESNQVANTNSLGDVFQIPNGQEDVFVLAPKQSLFAASVGGGGQASIAASEAMPVKYFMES